MYFGSVQETLGGPPSSGRPSSSPSRDFGAALVPAGVILTLAGLAGDLLAHTLAPAAHDHEELISFSSPNPWHLVLFAGIVVTALAGIRWAVRQNSEWGGLLGALMSLLLVATVAIGGWAGMRGTETNAASGGHRHPATGPVAGTGTSGTAETHVHAPSGGAVAGEGSEGESSFGEHAHGKPGPVTAAQRVVLNRQLADAKAATAEYRDIAAARADGYFQVTQFIPGLGLHMVNLQVANTAFDPAHPQILLYEPETDGSLRLVGVAYQFKHTDDTPPAGFTGGSDVWHYHTNLCFQKGGSVTIASDAAACRAVGGLYFQKQTAWLLHAWVWKTNPHGVFTEVNPNVA